MEGLFLMSKINELIEEHTDANTELNDVIYKLALSLYLERMSSKFWKEEYNELVREKWTI